MKILKLSILLTFLLKSLHSTPYDFWKSYALQLGKGRPCYMPDLPVFEILVSFLTVTPFTTTNFSENPKLVHFVRKLTPKLLQTSFCSFLKYTELLGCVWPHFMPLCFQLFVLLVIFNLDRNSPTTTKLSENLKIIHFLLL